MSEESAAICVRKESRSEVSLIANAVRPLFFLHLHVAGKRVIFLLVLEEIAFAVVPFPTDSWTS